MQLHTEFRRNGMALDIDDLDDLDELGDLGGDETAESGEEGEAGGESGSKKGGSKKTLIMAVVGLLAIGGGGAYFFMGSGDNNATVADGEELEEEAEEEAKSTPYYFSLDPAFVVNFVGKGQARFLQVNIDGITRDSLLKEDITTHLPHIRNNILMLLSNKTYDELMTGEGKEKLRKDVLKEVNNILSDETGNEGIEDIFFTSFVMQ
jgi:flagellar FliL protein